MTVARDLLLVALDPESGKVRLPSMAAEPALGGAALIDLVLLGRLELVGTGRKARVAVADRTPVDDPDLQAAFERVWQKGHQAPKSIVTRLGKKQRKAVLASLEADGLVRDEQRRVLGIRLERYELVDVARRDQLVGAMRQVLLHDQPADQVTGPLVGLLLAADQLGLVVEKREKKGAKARAKVVADGDWASEGVRKAIQDAQAAMTAAMTASIAASTTASTS
ncbi:GPP34 family phosphoprotein [Aeromicrobium sp. 50.2.37]|uniref:GOLPH3/VPS74 family protein n=1 Tax=Aeromicrobium sp. 50.2.37 TaxID=2969305 RepID=UPI0021505ADF|nr:GPP34 family phosphoprotein [Aeromicrobium sp. 50.2.37]MCR4513323.1 GPP34 family phosphoprotein [Aeromicrobium sp. 50.2.37]